MTAPVTTLPSFPYVPLVVRNYLRSKVDASWIVSTKVPKTKPQSLIVISTVPASGTGNPVLSVR